MDITELYSPQIRVELGQYVFDSGVEIEVVSSQNSYFDWGRITFTKQFQDVLSLAAKETAAVKIGYDGILNDIFTGYISAPYNLGDTANTVLLKDSMILLDTVTINNTFLSTTPQELLTYILRQAGISSFSLSKQGYPERRLVPIRQMSGLNAIKIIHAMWGISVPFFFSGDTFHWGTQPEQKKVYVFEYGVNILQLNRTNGRWELQTASVPFVRHSHKISVVHPRLSGTFEVSKIMFTTNDAGFLRTTIFF